MSRKSAEFSVFKTFITFDQAVRFFIWNDFYNEIEYGDFNAVLSFSLSWAVRNFRIKNEYVESNGTLVVRFFYWRKNGQVPKLSDFARNDQFYPRNKAFIVTNFNLSDKFSDREGSIASNWSISCNLAVDIIYLRVWSSFSRCS